MEIADELTDAERAVVRDRLIAEQKVRFGGQKKAAYTAAGVNSATWDNALAGTRVRPDRLVQIVTRLWPESEGDWDRVPAKPLRADATSTTSEPIDLAAERTERLLDVMRRGGPPDSFIPVLVDGLRSLGQRVRDLEARIDELVQEGGDGNVDADDAGDSSSTSAPDSGPGKTQSDYARAARKLPGQEPALRKRRREHDEATEAIPADPTGMEPI